VSYLNHSNHFILGLPGDIVPATFKKKKSTAVSGAVTKGYDEDEKPAAEEGSRPAGLGRGSR